jgi:hypothetical protein
LQDPKSFLWLVALVMFVLKLLADYYSARFKWVQAAQQRRSRSLDSSFEDDVVTRLSSPKYWGIPASATLLGLVFSFVAVKPDYLFPLLTAVTMTWFAMIAAMGAAGDRRREIIN